jgi:hypothetical protein
MKLKSIKEITFRADKATDAETWEAIEQKAEENGFNRYSKFNYSQVWTSEVRKCTVYESYYHKITGDQEERLHIIAENRYKEMQKDREEYIRTIIMD